MKINNYLGISLVLCAVLLASCTSLPFGLGGTSNTQRAQAATSGLTIDQTTSMDQRLIVGTLKLEGTDLAVTQQEAKDLLPLWKAVKALSANITTAPEETTALYQQIQDTMTPQQVQSIKDLTMTSEDMRTMMSKLGIQGGFNGSGNSQNRTPSQIATQAAMRSQQGGGEPGGGPGGMFGPGGGPGGRPGGGEGQQTTRTPSANSNRGNGRNGGSFIDILIGLLQKRAG